MAEPKPVAFLGSSLIDLRSFPFSARRDAGYQLDRVQNGQEPFMSDDQRFVSVWDAIEDTPEESENMKLRSVLMTALKNHLTRADMSQAQAAKLFGVTQPRISDLMRGKISLFGLDALVNMATSAGLHIELRILEEA